MANSLTTFADMLKRVYSTERVMAAVAAWDEPDAVAPPEPICLEPEREERLTQNDHMTRGDYYGLERGGRNFKERKAVML